MHTYFAVVALIIKYESRVQDLLAYASLIVKASSDYEGTAWLSYDSHFRRHAAAKSVAEWGIIRSDLWTHISVG